jgi:hypothetical protein
MLKNVKTILNANSKLVSCKWLNVHKHWILNNEQLHDLYFLPNIVRVIKSRSVQGVGGEAWRKETTEETQV